MKPAFVPGRAMLRRTPSRCIVKEKSHDHRPRRPANFMLALVSSRLRKKLMEKCTLNENNPFPLSYCSGRSETLARLGSLYEHRSQEQICAMFDVPTEAMRRFRAEHKDEFCEVPNPAERIMFWDAHLAERAKVSESTQKVLSLEFKRC